MSRHVLKLMSTSEKTRDQEISRIACCVTHALLNALCLFFALFSSGCEISNLDEGAKNTGIVEDEGELLDLQAVETTKDDNPIVDTDSDITPLAGGDGIGPRGESGGFLWKPVSETTAKLVVLLPPQYTGQVGGTFIGRADGSVIEQGRFASVANGGREHYRFSKPGADYGADLVVVADLKAGGAVHWPVANGAQRTTF